MVSTRTDQIVSRAIERGAEQSLQRWKNAKTRMMGKDFVHRETTISKNFLTRAEKQGLLVLPETATQTAKTHSKKASSMLLEIGA
jgi:hypothetical protein